MFAGLAVVCITAGAFVAGRTLGKLEEQNRQLKEEQKRADEISKAFRLGLFR